MMSPTFRFSLLLTPAFLFACSAASGGSDEELKTHGDALAADGAFELDEGLDEGLDPATPKVEAGGAEICGNGLDDNGDGEIDEGCPCSVGGTQKCYLGDPKLAGVGICAWGKQTCDKSGEFAAWGKCVGSVPPGKEACDGKLDENCDGKVDEGCPPPKADAGPPDTGTCTVSMKLDIDGDCVSAKCPSSAPYPIGCDIEFIGGTPCGCVASTPTGPSVFFKEGKVCDAGHLTGTLTCSCKPGTGLNATNCPIKGKTYKYYPTSSSGCPAGSCPI
jgi:hypothetical protein